MQNLLQENGLGIEQLEVRVRPGTRLEDGLQHAIVLAATERADVLLRAQGRTFHVAFDQLLHAVPEYDQQLTVIAAGADDEDDFDPACFGDDASIPLSGPG